MTDWENNIGNHDLGSGYSYSWGDWSPDRSIPENNEHYKNIPDIKMCSLVLFCPHGRGSINVNRPYVKEIFPNQPIWDIVQEVPLTLTPSIRKTDCGCHGYITNGKWVSA